jgi:Rhamnan synthesis protein F
MSTSRLHSFFGCAYRLRPIEPKGGDQIALLRIEGPEARKNLLLPYSIGFGYFVIPAGSGGLAIDAADFRVEALGALASLWARLRLALLFKKKKYLIFQEFSLFSYGPKPERRRFTHFNQHMFNIGVSLDGDLIAAHPELIEGWDDEPAQLRARVLSAGPHPLAVVAHVYYEETWPDLAGVLRRLAVPFDLIVTTAPGRERLIETIRREFPDANVEVMENRGRDVRPFLALLERGRLDRYRYVCKVHGKKSSDGGRKSYMGSLWRRRLLFDLLAAPGLARSIVDRFERDPSVGMIGPRAFRLPSDTYSLELSWSVNKERVLELAQRMGIPPDQYRLDFFGGTMFWVRPEALASLRKLELSGQFAEEMGLLDGGLEHAAERLFGAAVLAAGYRIEDIDGAEAAAGHEGGRAGAKRRTGLG